MKGIQYLVDDQGKQTSVLIDLQQWGELWEDFYDVIIAHERANEPEIDWEDIKAELDEETNLESVSN